MHGSGVGGAFLTNFKPNPPEIDLTELDADDGAVGDSDDENDDDGDDDTATAEVDEAKRDLRDFVLNTSQSLTKCFDSSKLLDKPNRWITFSRSSLSSNVFTTS